MHIYEGVELDVTFYCSLSFSLHSSKLINYSLLFYLLEISTCLGRQLGLPLAVIYPQKITWYIPEIRFEGFVGKERPPNPQRFSLWKFEGPG